MNAKSLLGILTGLRFAFEAVSKVAASGPCGLIMLDEVEKKKEKKKESKEKKSTKRSIVETY